MTKAAGNLTLKQEKFAVALMRMGNATAAYREAYAPKSMSDKTINEEASRLAANPKVSARLAELMAPAAKSAQLTADRVLEELAKATYSTPSDEIKWSDKLSAVEKSMKFLGLFEKDNAQISKPVSIKMVFE